MTSAERHAEEHCSPSDPKPAPRIRDPKALKAFHAGNPLCVVCGDIRVEAHHILSRAQGGDDVRQNLIALCHNDHMAYHGQPYREEYGGKRITPAMVRLRVGNWICSVEGYRGALYLGAKLGKDGCVEYIRRLGVDL